MPPHREVNRRFIFHRDGGFAPQKVTFRGFSLAIPLILSRERPNGVSGGLPASIFFYQSRRDGGSHFVIHCRRMLAADPERFQETLAYRGYCNPKFTHAVVNNCFVHGWIIRGLILDDFQRSYPGALLAPRTEKQ